MPTSDSCTQNYTAEAAVVQFTKGERPFSVRQNPDTHATPFAQGAGLAEHEREYLFALLSSVPARRLADLIIVRDGVATIRADIPLHALSLENACTLQGLAGGGDLPAPTREEPSALARRFPALTNRERDVLGLLCAGKSNRDIGRSLGLSEGSVKLRVTAVLKALGARNRTHAVMIVERRPSGGEG